MSDDKPAPGPAGWSCPTCGMYPQVRGCVPGKCETPAEPVKYDSEVHPMRGYVSVGPDGSLTPVMSHPLDGIDAHGPSSAPPPEAWTNQGHDAQDLIDAANRYLGPGEGAMDPVKPVEHPAPWYWAQDGDEFSLWDSSHRLVALADSEHEIVEAVRVLIAAAPEMEALLQRALFETEPNGVCGDIHETDDWRERLKALLARIDAAKAV